MIILPLIFLFPRRDRFAATAASGGYTVPDFAKISEAYGIRAVKLNDINELDQYMQWIDADEPCLFDIPLPEESFLTPKISFETGFISPRLDDEAFARAKEMLQR